ncbi:HupE/UreJ family protein [Undibacterium arcticum]
MATLQVISLPSRWVESAIAASVVLAALNNLFPLVQGKRWVVAFAFGLIHGFGFASVLTDLGLPQSALLLALVGFNLGVEIGQLAIVSVFFCRWPMRCAEHVFLSQRRSYLRFRANRVDRDCVAGRTRVRFDDFFRCLRRRCRAIFRHHLSAKYAERS